ncbi:hypothetical protein [Oceanirhabdus sp. W0125-5]|uniref:hypothetical protein n=1 Tax=Oceanirhabdus sp. W0125-5 TaxID=2999116 RepID=UPI0022F2CBBF|nr:hypothetical protein [Oceanirhabdus sp. W0125-5]WBW96125.1 hypothetical protein OW730_20890 [Oceanirhabdus sp. W0125-5]
MSLSKLLKIKETFDIIYIVGVNLKSGEIETIGDKSKLVYDDLVTDLFDNIDSIYSLDKSIEGQRMPQTWRQGEVKCIVCKPSNNILVGLFYNEYRDTIESYQWSKEVNKELEAIWKK